MLSKSNGMLGGGIQKSYVPIYQIYFPIWLMTIHQMLSILRSNPFIDFAHKCIEAISVVAVSLLDIGLKKKFQMKNWFRFYS